MGHYSINGWVQIGIIEINMSPFVGKGETHQKFAFEGQTATENAKVELTFLIASIDPAATGHGASGIFFV